MLLELRDHIVVCCFGDEETPTVGLVNFLMPLRASNIRRHELVPIVLLGDEQLLEREWHHVSHFPLVYTHVGCPLNRSDLRRVRTDRCRMCVILTRSDPPKEDPLLVDKESILCSLNIKTMTFPLVLDPYADPQQVLQSPTPTSIPTNPSHRRSLILERGHEEISNEKKSLKVASKTRCAFLRSRRHRSTFIPMLTELANDLNAQFLDQDDEDDPDLPLYMTQPFACGRTFAVSVLDALMSTVFFNPSSLDLIRAFVTGGGQVVPRVDDGSFAADGSDELLPCQLSPPEVLEIRKRSRLTLLPLRGNDRLEPLADGNYGQLVVEAMSQFGILCLGLYRRHKGSRSFASSSAAAAADAASDDGDNGGFLKHRYVVTNPPPQLRLWPSDEVYCLEPFSC